MKRNIKIILSVIVLIIVAFLWKYYFISLIQYFDCTDNAEVWLYEIVGGGHDWPGSSGNMDIEASEEIWSFFSQYTYILGDINNDGSVDVLDAIEVVSLVLNGEYNVIVDMNYDGIVNVLDIIEIIYIILN